MNILKDRTIWIAIVVLTIAGLYYWTVVDQSRVENMKDLDYPLSLQTFLLAVNENQEIDLNVNIRSKRSLIRGESISQTPSFARHTQYSMMSDSQDIVSYYISEPMYMRGVRIIQVGIEPYYYDADSNQVILYDNIDISVNLEGFDSDSIDNLKPTSADFNQIISSLAINYDLHSRENKTT